MSLQYDKYLKEHIANVYNGYLWIVGHIDAKKIDELLPGIKWENLMVQLKLHDDSKYWSEEYEAYDAYFYGPDGINDGNGGTKKASEKVQEEFNKAWLHHIHHNPHHWQYWVLFEDEPETGEKYTSLDIPNDFILEMICDWWSFSWTKGDLFEVFNWWDRHIDSVVMTDSSRRKVESLLNLIKDGLLDEKNGNFGEKVEINVIH